MMKRNGETTMALYAAVVVKEQHTSLIGLTDGRDWEPDETRRIGSRR